MAGGGVRKSDAAIARHDEQKNILADIKPWPDIVMRLFRIVMFSALCATLAACGNKGPLVLPDKKPSTTPVQPEKSQSQDSAKQP